MSLTKDLVLVILQFLNEQKHTETAHMLEKESGLYFDLNYFEALLIAGKFDEAESYLLGFTNLEDNNHSTKIFFEIRKHKYLEALDRKDRFKALEILSDDLKVFRNIVPTVYKEMTELVTMDNFRENQHLKHYRDIHTQRIAMVKEIKPFVQSNPIMRPKLMLPTIKPLRLRTLINQSLNWQHMACKTPQPNPDIRTLFVDHTCEPSTGALTAPPVNNHLMGSIQTERLFCPNDMNAQFQPQVVGPVASLSERIANPSPPVQHDAVTSGAAALVPHPNAGALLQRPGTPQTSNSGIVCPLTDSEHVMKKSRVGQVDEKLPDDGKHESKNWTFVEVTDPDHCRSMRLTDPLSTGKIVRLLYTYSGSVLLALDSDAVHKSWKWPLNDGNPSVKDTINVSPKFWQPHSGTLMINHTSDRDLEKVVPCMALSKNDSYVLSASGGKVSLFNFLTFQVIEKYMSPPPAATCLAFYPLDNNVIAIGLEDSTIKIYNTKLRKLEMTLTGHERRITGLAFSVALNVLISSGTDSKLCVWNMNGWEKCKSESIHSHAGKSPSALADTTVQFDNITQIKLLVVQESQIAIYVASELECVCHWAPRDPMPALISSATYSCDSLLVYASFFDGSIGVFDSDLLRPCCRIAPSAFIPSMQGSGITYPLVIAAHPHEPNQIAVGLTDGGVYVIEPKEKSVNEAAGSNHKDLEFPPR